MSDHDGTLAPPLIHFIFIIVVSSIFLFIAYRLDKKNKLQNQTEQTQTVQVEQNTQNSAE